MRVRRLIIYVDYKKFLFLQFMCVHFFCARKYTIAVDTNIARLHDVYYTISYKFFSFNRGDILLCMSHAIVLLLLLLLWYIVFVTYKANVMHFFRTNGSAFVNPLYVTHFRHSSSQIHTHTHTHMVLRVGI